MFYRDHRPMTAPQIAKKLGHGTSAVYHAVNGDIRQRNRRRMKYSYEKLKPADRRDFIEAVRQAEIARKERGPVPRGKPKPPYTPKGRQRPAWWAEAREMAGRGVKPQVIARLLKKDHTSVKYALGLTKRSRERGVRGIDSGLHGV